MSYQLRKHDLTKEVLDRNKIWVEFNEEGQPLIYQEYIQTEKRNTEKRWSTLRTQRTTEKQNKYSGNTYKNKNVGLKIDGRTCYFIVSNIVWVYFNGAIPEGHDVDHINNDTSDNRLENLQLLTRQENLHKRGAVGFNQYNCHLSEEERIQLHLKNSKNKEEARERVEHSKKVREQKDILEKMYGDRVAEKHYWRDIYNNARQKWHEYPISSIEKDYYKGIWKIAKQKMDILQAERVLINKYIHISPLLWDLSESDIVIDKI